MNGLTPARLLDPVLDLLLVLAIGLVLVTRAKSDAHTRRRRRWGLGLAWAAWGTLWLFSTPGFSFAALSALEVPPIDLAAALRGVPEERCAMVVLTGGTRLRQPGSAAWPPELLEGSSLPRAIGAARLYRERPVGHVIVTGRGEPWGYPDNTASSMAEVMVAFGVPRERIVIERLATNTRENAILGGGVARSLGAEAVVVVTSAVHLPRAVREHERLGIQVIAAPVHHLYEEPQGIAPFIPSAGALLRTAQVVHEVLGRHKP